MHHVARCLAVSLSLVFVACARPDAAPHVRAEPVARAQPAVAPVSAARHFGSPLEDRVQSARLGDIVASPAQFEGHPVRVEGTVSAVCQAAGCWMEIRDASTQAHIRMHGHSFFVPRDIAGRHASIEATVVGAHPATECDQEAAQATGRVAQVELDATGVVVD